MVCKKPIRWYGVKKTDSVGVFCRAVFVIPEAVIGDQVSGKAEDSGFPPMRE